MDANVRINADLIAFKTEADEVGTAVILNVQTGEFFDAADARLVTSGMSLNLDFIRENGDIAAFGDVRELDVAALTRRTRAVELAEYHKATPLAADWMDDRETLIGSIALEGPNGERSAVDLIGSLGDHRAFIAGLTKLVDEAEAKLAEGSAT